jgi:MFS family permease
MTRDLLLVAASLFLWGFGEGMFFYFIPLSLQSLGANPLMIGGVYAGIGLAAALMQIPAGILSDRIGPRTIMWIAWGIGALACMILAVASTLAAFSIGIWLYYMTSFGVVPLNSYVTSVRGKLSPERALTFTGGLFNAGMIAGPILGGLIANQMGLQKIYPFSAYVFVISTVIIFFIKPVHFEPHPQLEKPGKIWRNTRFLGFLALVFITVFVLYLPQPLTPNFLQNEQGLTTIQIGLLGTIGGLGNTVTLLVLGSLKAFPGVLVGELMVMVFAISLLKGTGMGWYGFGYFMLAGFKLSRAMLVGLSRPLIHPALVGIAFGLIETCASIAIILSPLLAGYLYEQQPSIIYAVCLVLVTASIFLNAYFLPRFQRKGFSENVAS